MMKEISRETLSLVYGGDGNGGKAVGAITTAAAIGAAAGVSGQLTAAGGWTAFGSLGAASGAAALGGIPAAIFAGYEIGTAINNVDFVNRNLGYFVDWIVGPP